MHREKEEVFFLFLLYSHSLDKIGFLSRAGCFPKHFYAWSFNPNDVGTNFIDNILSSFWKFIKEKR